MKTVKRILSVLMTVALVAVMFAGCSSKENQKYSDEVCIIGYTESVAPFLEVDKNGKATGFYADLWKNIFDDVKGDLKSYVFEKIDDGYQLEEEGGFTNKGDNNEYSACLLMGAVKKNSGTFNEDYSYTEPIITDRVISITKKGSKIKTYSDFDGAKVITLSDAADSAVKENAAVFANAKSVETAKDIDSALKAIDSGDADVLVTDEFTLMPTGKAKSYTELKGELDTIDYVIACKKYSGWKDSINEAVREQKSTKYGNGNTFTPLVEKYFGYNASSFNYVSDGDKQ